MGSNMSILEGSGLPLEALTEQANQIVRQAAELISKMMESETNELENFEERAATRIEEAFKVVEEKIKEFLQMGEKAKSCVTEKTSELLEIRSALKDSMLKCYQKHSEDLTSLQNERLEIQNDANKFKLDAQNIIQNCMENDDRLNCLQTSITNLAERGGILLKKFKALVKKEAEVRIKVTRALIECDKKAIDEARKHGTRIIEEITKCLQPVVIDKIGWK